MSRWIIVGGVLLLAVLWAMLLWTPAAQPELHGARDPIPEAVTEVVAPPAQVPAATTSTPPQPSAAAPVAQLPQLQPSAPAEAEPPATASAPTYKLPKLPPPEPSGPVNALKLRFGNESHTQSSKQHEQQLTASLQHTGPPLGSVDNVECRRSTCRVRWRWKTEQVIPFYQAIGALRRDIDKNLGIDAATPPDADAARMIDIYLDVSAAKPLQ